MTARRLVWYGIIAVLGYVFIKHVLIHLLITIGWIILIGVAIFAAIVIMLPPAKKENQS